MPHTHSRRRSGPEAGGNRPTRPADVLVVGRCQQRPRRYRHTLAPLGGCRVHERVIFQAAIAACLILFSIACSKARHELASGDRWAISSGSVGSSSARDGLRIRV